MFLLGLIDAGACTVIERATVHMRLYRNFTPIAIGR